MGFQSVVEYMQAFAPLLGEGESVVAQPWARSTPAGIARLEDHLREHYGIDAKSTKELDQCVFIVTPKKGPKWIARVDNVGRPMAQSEGDAEFLRHLEAHDYPAERLHEKGITELDGRAVMVTGFVKGKSVGNTTETLPVLGDLTGRLHTLPAGPPATLRPAGGWHRLSLAGGGRSADRDALIPMLQWAREHAADESRKGMYDTLIEELSAISDFDDLPQSLIHIDLGGPNLLSGPDGFVGIDWAGAGTGARISGLATLMCGTKKPDLARAFLDGYRPHVKFDDAELTNLAAAMRTHGLVLEAWVVLFVPDRLEPVVKGLATERRAAQKAADAVASVL